jgi:hypothetical protein
LIIGVGRRHFLLDHASLTAMRFLILLVIVLGTLALFNPSQEDFTTFIQDRTRDVVTDVGRSAGGSLLGSVTGAVAGTVAGAIAGQAVERKNFLVFSLYTVDLNGARHEGGEWTFLGIGGQFFEMERPEILED